MSKENYVTFLYLIFYCNIFQYVFSKYSFYRGNIFTLVFKKNYVSVFFKQTNEEKYYNNK